jgi:hypothetical protein
LRSTIVVAAIRPSRTKDARLGRLKSLCFLPAA